MFILFETKMFGCASCKRSRWLFYKYGLRNMNMNYSHCSFPDLIFFYTFFTPSFPPFSSKSLPIITTKSFLIRLFLHLFFTLFPSAFPRRDLKCPNQAATTLSPLTIFWRWVILELSSTALVSRWTATQMLPWPTPPTSPCWTPPPLPPWPKEWPVVARRPPRSPTATSASS